MGKGSPVRTVGSFWTSTNEGVIAGTVERLRGWLIPIMKATAGPRLGSSHFQDVVEMVWREGRSMRGPMRGPRGYPEDSLEPTAEHIPGGYPFVGGLSPEGVGVPGPETLSELHQKPDQSWRRRRSARRRTAARGRTSGASGRAAWPRPAGSGSRVKWGWARPSPGRSPGKAKGSAAPASATPGCRWLVARAGFAECYTTPESHLIDLR